MFSRLARQTGPSLRLRMPLMRPSRPIARNLSIGPRTKGLSLVVNIVAGAYIGGLVVCLGSLYLVYQDADARQSIPFLLSFHDQVTAVKAISKDDVLKSPRYAVKHYRRLLIDLAKQENPDLEFCETNADGLRNYAVPLLSADTLVHRRSHAFANFYIDVVLRYAKSLLAKGQLEVSLGVLREIIDNDDIFYSLGDPERMSQCCRLLSRVSPSYPDRIKYLQRSIDMLAGTYLNIHIDSDYLLQGGTKVTDELILSLDGLAGAYASLSKQKGHGKKDLSRALNIYLANLKTVSEVRETIETERLSQASFPLFNCDAENLNMTIAEIKAHVSEVLWAMGYKKNAVAWSEEVVDDIYFDHSSYSRALPILISVLNNLITMYGRLRDTKGRVRCEQLLRDLRVFEGEPVSWYDSVVHRFTQIIYYRGPLGVIEKALKERFGAPQRVPDIEEHEDENEET